MRVLVIGGGPAGSTAAAVLAAQGVDVVLLERERFPRPHVGESLQPATVSLLDHHLGLGKALANQGFARKYGAIYVWGERREPWSVLFDERLETDLDALTEEALLAGGYEHSWQVDRAVFDQLLLDEARRRGVDVREGVEITEPVRHQDRVVGVQTRSGAVLHGDVVIDASGQRCVVGRALGLVQDVDDLRSTATYGYYTGAGGVPGPLARHVQLVVTLPRGWAWFIPISPERTSVGVVIGERRRLEADEFEDLVAAAGFPVEGAHRDRDLRFARDWSFALRSMTGPGWLAAGDAACFVDPILSGGVDFAVRAACNAAMAVLSARDGRESAAFLAYEANLRREYQAYLGLARYWYGNNRSVDGLFWEARKAVRSGAVTTPLRAFVYLTSGRYAADRHFKVFSEWQEQKMFRELGVDRTALRSAVRPQDR